MFKYLKKLFKKSIINNSRGSALSVSLIVITILTFTIANISSISANLANTTTIISEGIVDDNAAKGLIRQTIDEFETYLDTHTYKNYLDDKRNDDGCIEEYNVCVTDDTLEQYGSEQSEDSRVFRFSVDLGNGQELVKYLYFSIGGAVLSSGEGNLAFGIGSNENVLLNGGLYTDISIFAKEARISTSATYFNDYRNGSVYKRTNKNKSFFPDFSEGYSKIYYSSVYEFCDQQDATCYNINQEDEFPYVIKESNFITVEGVSNLEITDGVAAFGTSTSDFFEGFVFDQYIIDNVLTGRVDAATISNVTTLDQLKSTVLDNLEWATYSDTLEWVPATGTGGGSNGGGYGGGNGNGNGNSGGNGNGNSFWSQIITLIISYLDGSYEGTWADLWDDFVDGYYNVVTTPDELPDSPFIGIASSENVFSSSAGHHLEYSAVWNDDLTLKYDLTIDPDEILVVFGDLTIYNQENSTLDLTGNIYVAGDVYFKGNSVDIEGSIMAGNYYTNSGTVYPTGGTKIDFNQGEGIYTSKTKGFTLLSKDSVYINSMFESHVDVIPSSDVLRAFIYSEESIIVDAVNSQVNLEGALLARAQSASTSATYVSEWNIQTKNTNSEVIHGILINSFRGYIDQYNNGNEVSRDTGDSDWNRFKISALTGTLDENFDNIPGFDFLVTVNPEEEGSYYFQTSEFIYE